MRLIDADALKLAIERYMEKILSHTLLSNVIREVGNDMIFAIDVQQTVDAAPVKYGYWTDTGSGQECSICGEIQYGYDSGRFYCPNCGAKMDSRGWIPKQI